MCEFCIQHGDGEKWYLRARNYSEDLLSDARRRRLIADFFGRRDQPAKREGRRSLGLRKRMPPFVQRALRARASRRMRRSHFGQVLPLEDVERIFAFVNSIVRVPCACRHTTLGREERYCYGVSLGPGGGAFGELLRDLDDSFLGGPDGSDLEALTSEAALQAFAEHEDEGLCHTVWTFVTPFIGGICNCDRSDCLAMRATVSHDVKTMFRAEYVAAVEADLCTGCRSCMRFCQFGALGYSAANKKAVVDQSACYGCGVCRSACAQDAVHLLPRRDIPAVVKFW
jgi:Pyruvate/2-oxoacid:ferredoxin oxidoreductase delta subunit